MQNAWMEGLVLTLAAVPVSFVAGTVVGVPIDEWLLPDGETKRDAYKKSVAWGYVIGVPVFFAAAVCWSWSHPSDEAKKSFVAVATVGIWFLWSLASSVWSPWARVAGSTAGS